MMIIIVVVIYNKEFNKINKRYNKILIHFYQQIIKLEK